MAYSIYEVFYSLQGEGFHAGRPAVFCRFSECNLSCSFCDTIFKGTDGQNGGRFESADALVDHLHGFWPEGSSDHPFVVLTGGEPLLQVDDALVYALHKQGFEIAAETNGTVQAPEGIDWLTVSPKAGAPFVQTRGHELKLVYPQPGLDPEQFADFDFAHRYLQPLDGPDADFNRRATLNYCLAHPRWSLSLQLHKVLGID
ncbi:MAG: 7-carboxy-7-deazaguanine synthase [Planctomycetota bacterium]|jgi:7-carboxy-7-deazaguanine synthase (Cx14CxxC type)